MTPKMSSHKINNFTINILEIKWSYIKAPFFKHSLMDRCVMTSIQWS